MKKKKILKFLTGILISCALAGSATAVSAEEAMDIAADETSGQDMVTSYLTGEEVPAGIGRRRPIAVMRGNDINGAPQSGTANAGVIYEAPVEGGITRLMAIIEDYDSLGGFIIEHLDRLPVAGDEVVTDDGIRLVVEKLDKNRIEKVHVYLPENLHKSNEEPEA